MASQEEVEAQRHRDIGRASESIGGMQSAEERAEISQALSAAWDAGRLFGISERLPDGALLRAAIEIERDAATNFAGRLSMAEREVKRMRDELLRLRECPE